MDLASRGIILSIALISFAVTAKLICVFVFANAKSRFSHNEARMISICLAYKTKSPVSDTKTFYFIFCTKRRTACASHILWIRSLVSTPLNAAICPNRVTHDAAHLKNSKKRPIHACKTINHTTKFQPSDERWVCLG